MQRARKESQIDCVGGRVMRRTSWAVLFVVCAAAVASIAAAPAPQGSGYHLLKKLTLGGDGGWDYLSTDPMSHRLFISRGTHIMVVDADGNVVGDIPNVQGTHGAQIVNEFSRGFSSNGRSNSVTIFDLKTLATINEVKLPMADGPDGFAYDPASKNVFVFNARSQMAPASMPRPAKWQEPSPSRASRKLQPPTVWATCSSTSRIRRSFRNSIRKNSK